MCWYGLHASGCVGVQFPWLLPAVFRRYISLSISNHTCPSRFVLVTRRVRHITAALAVAWQGTTNLPKYALCPCRVGLWRENCFRCVW